MSEYIDWQPDDSPIKVRVHRRVLAGIEREGVDEFRGVLLGSASAVSREVLVEDFARLEPGPDFRPIEDWFAGWNRHSLPAVGYFRAGAGEQAQITENDRDLFAKYFPDKLNVLLPFQIRDGKAQLAPVPVPAGGRIGQLPDDIGAGTRAPLWEGDLPQRVGELAALTQPPPQEREASLRPDEPGITDRMPFPERAQAEASVEPKSSGRNSRKYLAQIAAVTGGFLLGVLGYLALRGDKPRQIAPAIPPASRSAPQQTGKTRAATQDTSASTTPVTPASTARPSPFDRPSEANRSVDAGGAAANRTDTEQHIRSILARWTDTLLDSDVTAHVNLYAPTVSPYFTKKSATRAQIRGDIRQTLGRYGEMSVYKISDINITPVDANNAFATFRKHWETEGNKFSGEEREQLKLTRKGGNWLIASEREVKVFWVKKK